MGFLLRTVECSGDGTFPAGIAESCRLQALAIHYAGSQTSVNDVWALTETGTPAGGSFTITTQYGTSVPIAYNASDAVIQAAVNGIAGTPASLWTVSDGPINTAPVHLTSSKGPQNTLTVNSAGLTGGASPAVTPVHTTTGVFLTVVISNVGPFGNAKPIYTNTGDLDVPLTTITEASVSPAGVARAWYIPPMILGELEVVVSGSGAPDTHGHVCYVQLVIEV